MLQLSRDGVQLHCIPASFGQGLIRRGHAAICVSPAVLKGGQRAPRVVQPQHRQEDAPLAVPTMIGPARNQGRSPMLSDRILSNYV